MLMTILYVLIPLVLIGIDQAVKYWTLNVLAPMQTSIPVIEGVFQLTYVENRGSAFGLLQNQQVLFIILTCVVALAFIYGIFIYPDKKKLPVFPRVLLAVILGGALGNFIDRLWHGFVVDTFDFCLINFPVFNVADSCICVGVILLCIWILFIDGRQLKKNKALTANPAPTEGTTDAGAAANDPKND